MKLHKHSLVLFVILIISPAIVIFGQAQGQVITTDKLEESIGISDNLHLGYPSTNCLIINRKGYSLGYCEQYEQAYWVQYKLTKREVLNKACNRTDDFRTDPLISTGSAELEDYRHSGYDRGHLAPAANMHFSRKTMSESFYLSNMSPQKPRFNRVIWRKLEKLVRNFAVNNEAVYVVTGPVLEKGIVKSIGKNQVGVPGKYYKVILDYQKPGYKAIGFLLLNKGSSRKLASFATSVDRIEEETELDFFSELPDSLENALEGTFNIKDWKWDNASFQYIDKSSNESSRSDKSISSDLKGRDYPYVASKTSSVFHNVTCSYARKISKGKRVYYRTREQAIRDGKRPCKKCKL